MIVSLQEIRLLLLRLSVALLAYPVLKILFLLFNGSYFSEVSLLNFIAILFYGLRFDIAALALMNIPFVLFHIVPFPFVKKKWYQLILKTVFLFMNGIAILADCVDLEYFNYTFKRTTSDFFNLFGLGSDITTMLPQYLKDFWYVLLIASLLIVLLAWLYNKVTIWHFKHTVSNSTPSNVFIRISSWLVLNAVLIGLMIIGFRGGLQLRPIMPINASEYVSAQYIPLVVNTPFSIIKSYGLEKLEEKDYFTEGELIKTFNPIHKTTNVTQQTPNVFIIILESFSKEYTGLGRGKSYTPFLDSLMKESMVYDNAFANGKRSIEGIPAILSSIPSLMNESFITSAYCSNQINSLPNALRNIGYSSAFFHGGANGTMGFDAFCGSAGFDKYYGKLEYNNDADYDGEWGIWDEPFLQYTVKEVNKMKTPFCATVFTLSSHHPYKLPEKYNGQFEEGDLPIHRSVRYADHSLKEFFESASKEKWFDSTLFVITADHTGPSNDSYYSNSAGIFAVPIVFYKHNSELKGKDSKEAQHIDILPTVLNRVAYKNNYFSFGNDLMDSTSQHFVVNFMSDVYQLFQNDYLLQFDGTNTIGLFNYKTDSLLSTNLLGNKPAIEKEMANKLKAIIQTYHHGMISNALTPREK